MTYLTIRTITYLDFIHHNITFISYLSYMACCIISCHTSHKEHNICMVHLCLYYAQFILNLLSLLILLMGPLHECTYRARDHRLTLAIVQPDLVRVGTTQATLLAILFSFHLVMSYLILLSYKISWTCFVMTYIHTYVLKIIHNVLHKLTLTYHT